MVVRKKKSDQYLSRTKLMRIIGGGHEFPYVKMEKQ